MGDIDRPQSLEETCLRRWKGSFVTALLPRAALHKLSDITTRGNFLNCFFCSHEYHLTWLFFVLWILRLTSKLFPSKFYKGLRPISFDKVVDDPLLVWTPMHGLSAVHTRWDQSARPVEHNLELRKGHHPRCNHKIAKDRLHKDALLTEAEKKLQISFRMSSIIGFTKATRSRPSSFLLFHVG